MTNENVLNTSLESHSSRKLLFGSFTGWMAFAFTFLIAAFLVWYIFKWGDESNVNLICDFAQAISSMAAFISAWHISRTELLDEQTKRAWKIITLALFSYFCGQAIWFYLSSILHEEPFPSTADIGYSLFYPLMLWALRTFPTAPQTSTEKRNFWLDASTVMVTGLLIVWHFVISPTIATGDEPLKIGLNLIYVIGDMILFLGIITILLKQPKQYSQKALYTIILGLVSISIADIGFAYYTLQNISPTGAWFDAFFSISSYFMIIAAFFQYNSAKKHIADETTNTFQGLKFGWLPYISIAIGYLMLLAVSTPYWSEPVGVFIFATFAITGLVVLRQIASVRENLRLEAEKANQKSEHKLKEMLENSSELTTITDEQGNFEYISPAIEKFFGYDNKKLNGTNIYDLIHPKDNAGLIHMFSNSEGYNINMPVEFRLKHSDGSWRDLDGIAQLLFDEETKTKRILVNSRDVTDRKAAEIRLLEYNKKLRQSNRELQDFAFVASHDLQEPLRKVQAFGDRLATKYSDKLGEHGLDYLNRMQNASHRMQVLIADLLTFSRVTTQAKPFAKRELNSIITGVISDIEVKIEETNAQISVEKLPEFEMDETQMRQLFQNLLGNALKFSKPNESPIIKIWSEVNENSDSTNNSVVIDDLALTDFEIPRGYCRIFVEDNGIGFDEKYLDRIFTVFQRLHGRTEYEGSGVGLAVCRKIVERHNGYITAKSIVNKGTKFIITLPLNQTTQGEIND